MHKTRWWLSLHWRLPWLDPLPASTQRSVWWEDFPETSGEEIFHQCSTATLVMDCRYTSLCPSLIWDCCICTFTTLYLIMKTIIDLSKYSLEACYSSQKVFPPLKLLCYSWPRCGSLTFVAIYRTTRYQFWFIIIRCMWFHFRIGQNEKIHCSCIGAIITRSKTEMVKVKVKESTKICKVPFDNYSK